MRSRARATLLARIAVLLCVSTASFAASTPSAADLARCAKIADSGARLDCYDALAGKTSSAAAAAPAGAPAAASAPAAAAAAPAAPASPAAAATFSSDPQNFGFTEAQRSPAASQAAPKAINARITKLVESRVGQSYAELDNGQIWVFIDSDQDAGLRPQDAIVIKRGALGSYLLITPSHHSYHVRRTQ